MGDALLSPKPTAVEKFQVWKIKSMFGHDEILTVVSDPYVSYIKGTPHTFIDGFYLPDETPARIPVERMLTSRAWKFVA